MPQVISTALTTAVSATPFDPVLVTATGSVSVTTDYGLRSSPGLRATVLGSLSAGRYGILAGDPGSQPISDNLLTIGVTGVVQGGDQAVTMGNGGRSIIRNSGLVQGGNEGISISGQQTLIVNEGQISGLNGSAIEVHSYDATSVFTFDNYGTVIGSASLADNQASRIAVTGSATVERITNSGVILGGLDLRGGNDFYDGRFGMIRLGAISPGAGDDTVWGGAGEETVALGGGGQAIKVDLRLTHAQATGEGMDVIRGVEHVETGSGADELTGNDLANALRSGGGADTLNGGAGDDTLEAGMGDDLLEGGLGDDILAGGDGDDTAVFSGAVRATVDLRLQGRAQDTGYGFDILTGIETLVGGSGCDRFIGDDAANRLSGSAGNDTLQGGAGNDTLDGGDGSDTAVFSGARAAYRITHNGDGSATVTGPDGTDVVRNVRFLQFADGVSALTNANPTALAISAASVVENAPVGTVVAAILAQDADGDRISYSLSAGSPFAVVGNTLVVAGPLDFEAARQHTVTIQARDDYGGLASQAFTLTVANAVESTPFVLRGGSGADVLQGEAGHDTLYGGAGKDVLTGGAGRDVFVFDTRPNKRTNLDRLTDFNVKDDSIWLDNKVFTKLGAGSLAKPKKLKSDMFVKAKKAQDAEDRIVYDHKTGKLYYDQDGTGAKAQVQIATLSKNLKLTHNDFFVV